MEHVGEAEDDAVIDEMVRFENAVHEAAERGGWGMLVAVVTNGAGREWLWHVADATEFTGEMRGALEKHPIYPFEVRAWGGPTCKATRELNPRASMR